MGLKYEWLSLRSWSWRTAVVATVALACAALTGVVPAGAIPVPNANTDSSGTLNPLPHQMTEFNFLLGTFKCTVPDSEGLKDIETTRKIFNGEYYQQTATLYIPGEGTVAGIWTIGWDPVNHHFSAQYYDNVGNSGAGTSPGWQDGNLRILGNYVIVDISGGISGVGAGLHETGEDDFQVVGPGHYTDTNYSLKNGKLVKGGVSDCRQA
jgi:hypothetical protein